MEEVLMAGMAFSTVAFVVHSFFSYLKFRRTNNLGKGTQADVEELAAAFQHYIHKTNKRIEHLEAIQSEPVQDMLATHMDEEMQFEESTNDSLKNRLEELR